MNVMEKELENTLDKYFSGLTEAEWAEADLIEKELNAYVQPGFTEKSSAAFVMTVPLIRKHIPEATVSGIFDTALQRGLASLLDFLTPEHTNTPKRTTKKSTSGRRLVK